MQWKTLIFQESKDSVCFVEKDAQGKMIRGDSAHLLVANDKEDVWPCALGGCRIHRRRGAKSTWHCQIH